MPLIIKDGPNGQTGGVPFPEVKQDIEEMEKAGKAFNPIVLKIIPQFLIPVKKNTGSHGAP